MLAVVLLLILPSCAVLQSAPFDAGGATLRLTTQQETGYQALYFAAGSLDAHDVKVFVSGEQGAQLVYNSKLCKPYLNAVECDLGLVPADKTYALYFRNAREADAFYRRPDGVLYTTRFRR